jgi:hypothetical protein
MKKLTGKILFLAVLSSSCTHYYYVPNVQNVPLFREKNECCLSATYGIGDESRCVEVQAAYSITDNIGVMTNFISAKGGDVSDDNEDWGKGNYLEGAIGYYKPIEKYSVLEIYGGVGGGNQNHHYMSSNYDNGLYSETYAGTSELSFTKIFIQPSFGLTFKPFDIAVSTRICGLFYGTIFNNIFGDTYQYDKLNTIADKRNYYYLEPAITIRGGWKYVKLQLQGAITSYFNNPDFNFEDYHISIGLYITIAERYNKDIPKR